jgi:DNA polymerase III alpha subunit (gram-positive type)
MKHLDGNIICVVDCETTGLNPEINDIWQFCCIPLDWNLNVDTKYMPFEIKMQPLNKECIDRKAVSKKLEIELMLTGMNPFTAADVFDEWYHRLPLGHKKRIMPLAHNWIFDRAFMCKWLGNEGFDYYFDPRYRDTMAIAAYINDICDFQGQQRMFGNYRLHHMCTTLDIEFDNMAAHNAAYDCYKTAEIYKRLLIDSRYMMEETRDSL